MGALKRFMKAATAEQREELARRAKTSVGQLQQLAGGHRNCGPELAQRIEQSVTKMREKHPKLNVVLRTDLCAACRSCEFAKRCV